MDSKTRPIVFTITYLDPCRIRVYTTDHRWANENLDMNVVVSPFCLFDCLQEISVSGNIRNYAVLFEVG